MAKKSAPKQVDPTSRWFRVIGPRFDWVPKYGVMVSFPQGYIGFRPEECLKAGLAQGVIERIEKPEGYSVDKAGNVKTDGN